jgi:precorrin-2 dehydrogenase/sirohydrochlorin ferrochelatase
VTHSSYPVALDLHAKPCLVVGGGALAAEKVEGLLRVSARLRVVDPAPNGALRVLGDAGAIDLVVREYEPEDLEGMTLAYGASDDRELNARVAGDARRAGVLVNAVDDIPNCDFFAMSLVRRGELQIAISTNGRSPAFARWMREYIDAWLPRELGGLLDVLGDVRDAVRRRGEAPPYNRWNAAITEEVVNDIRHGDDGAARAKVRETLRGQGGVTPQPGIDVLPPALRR